MKRKSQLCAASLSLRVCEDKAGILSTTSMQEGQPTMALTTMGSLEFPTNLMFIESKKKLEYTETQRHRGIFTYMSLSRYLISRLRRIPASLRSPRRIMSSTPWIEVGCIGLIVVAFWGHIQCSCRYKNNNNLLIMRIKRRCSWLTELVSGES